MPTYNSYIAYRDNNSWTSERGASKFMHSILTTNTNGVGDGGGIINGFNVTATATPSMAVLVSSGEVGVDSHCVINYNNYCYFAWMTQDFTLTISGSSQSASRISYIVGYIDRATTYVKTDNIIESPELLKIVEVQGTASNSPVPPTSAQIQSTVGANNPYIILASVSVPMSTSSITNSLITDMRQFSKIDSGKLGIDPDDFYSIGVKQANSDETKTRIVVTEPNEAGPSAIDGVQIIWLKKKA